jgi:oligopeptide/dipeptide ABC transporter ATP-binding protein
VEPILEVRNLKTHFITRDSTTRAVDGVSFSVAPGETFGLVGESGCGKSATCRSILQLIHKPGKTVGGEVFYKGKDILKMSPSELRKVRGGEIGMIFQEPMTSLNPVLKIREQIYENLKDKGMTAREKNDRAIELLKLVGIPIPESRLNEYIHQYSGGMRQRAMIAIALAANPKVLLADEPTTALDVTIQDQIIKLLGRLKAQLGLSVILITHDLGVVAQMCDNVAVMYAGHIVEKTDTNTLLTRPRHPYTYGLIRSIPTGLRGGQRLESIEGSPPDLSRMPEGCPFAPRCRFKEEACLRANPEMREIGPGHTVACHYTEKLEGIMGLPSSEGSV